MEKNELEKLNLFWEGVYGERCRKHDRDFRNLTRAIRRQQRQYSKVISHLRTEKWIAISAFVVLLIYDILKEVIK